MCYYSYLREHPLAYLGMQMDAAFDGLSPLLDIVDRKTKALAHNTKDLCGI